MRRQVTTTIGTVAVQLPTGELGTEIIVVPGNVSTTKLLSLAKDSCENKVIGVVNTNVVTETYECSVKDFLAVATLVEEVSHNE